MARVVARLNAMRAKALAASRHSGASLSALEDAARALGGTDDDEYGAWTAYFDEGSLAAETATALHLLADLAGAETPRHAGADPASR